MRYRLLLVMLAFAWTANADPRMWGESGREFRGDAPIAAGPSATNAQGITLLTWADSELGRGDIHGQLLNAAGQPLWGEGGRALVASDVRSVVESVYPWVDGFLLVLFRANNSWNGGDLFMLPVDQDGNALWSQNNSSGVNVSNSGGEAELSSLEVLTDGTITFCYYIFDSWHESFEVKAQRVNTNGELEWATPVQLLPWGQNDFESAYDFDGHLYTIWSERPNWDTTVYKLAKYDASGEQLWLREMDATGPSGSGIWTSLLAVQEEGCYLLWTRRDSTYTPLQIQRFSSDGIPMWLEPTILDNSTFRITYTQLLKNKVNGSESGAIATWYEESHLPQDSGGMRAQKISAMGELQWSPDNVQLCFAGMTPSYGNATITSDGEGGIALFAGRDVNNGQFFEHTLFANHISASGNAIWNEPCGVTIESPGEAYYGINLTANPIGGYHALTWSTWAASNVVKALLLNSETGERLPPTEGNVWATGLNGAVSSLQALSLGAGRAVALWIDSRDNEALYFQIVDQAGNTFVEQHGRPAFDIGPDRRVNRYTACPDGVGGFYSVIERTNALADRLITAHFRADGSSSPTVLEITSAPDSWSNGTFYPQCVSDGETGCFIAWDIRPITGQYHIGVVHLDSSLTEPWSPVLVQGENTSIGLTAIEATQDGGCVVVWSGPNSKLGATKLRADRSVAWTTTLRDTTGSPSDVQIAVDSSRNIYVAWLDGRSTIIYPDVYAQKLSPEGVPQLQSNGVQLATRADDFGSSPLKLLADSDIYLVHLREISSEENSLIVHKYNSQFEPLWSDTGIQISGEPAWFYRQSAVLDGDGGIIVAWSPSTDGVSAISLIMHLNEFGEPADEYWSESGGVFCEGAGGQYAPVLARGSNTDEFYCFWEDFRAYDQVYGQYFDESPASVEPPDPPVPNRLTLAQNFPNPFNSQTEIMFNLSMSGRAMLSVYDVTGRLTQTVVDAHFNSGDHRVTFAATGLATGIYFYELQVGDARAVRKMLLLK